MIPLEVLPRPVRSDILRASSKALPVKDPGSRASAQMSEREVDQLLVERVQRGRRQGWLMPEGVEEICNFISPAKGDSMHFSGSHRCEYMRKCYADPTIR